MTSEEVAKSGSLIVNLLHILNEKNKLTQDIIDNVVSMLVEESGILLEKNKIKEHMDIRKLINLVETVEVK